MNWLVIVATSLLCLWSCSCFSGESVEFILCRTGCYKKSRKTYQSAAKVVSPRSPHTLQERTTLNPAQPYKQAYITRDGTENGRIVECSRGSPDINKKPHIFFYFRLSKIMVIGAYSGCWHRAKWLLTLLRRCVSLFLFRRCNVLLAAGWLRGQRALHYLRLLCLLAATWESLIRQKCPVTTFTPCTFALLLSGWFGGLCVCLERVAL